MKLFRALLLTKMILLNLLYVFILCLNRFSCLEISVCTQHIFFADIVDVNLHAEFSKNAIIIVLFKLFSLKIEPKVLVLYISSIVIFRSILYRMNFLLNEFLNRLLYLISPGISDSNIPPPYSVINSIFKSEGLFFNISIR